MFLWSEIIMNREVTAIVPARKESNRLKNKNILPFGESTLLEHKLSQLKRVKEISQIVVSSEDEEILEIAKKNDVCIIKRPDEYARPECPFGRFVEHICSQVEGDDILWACCTSPFVDDKLYSYAISLYREKLYEDYDSLISVQKLNRFVMDKNGPINYQKGLRHKNSDQLEDLLLYTNGVVIAPRKSMIEWKYIWGNIPYFLEVDKKIGIDISDQYDYDVARFLYSQEGIE